MIQSKEIEESKVAKKTPFFSKMFLLPGGFLYAPKDNCSCVLLNSCRKLRITFATII